MKLRSLKLTCLAVLWLSVCAANAYELNPGETYPDKLEIAVGTSANISCRMNPNIFQDRNASDLYFVNGNTHSVVDKSDIAILNATTIVFMLRNAQEQQTTYLCKCGPDAIMDTKVYVGTPPRPVNDFKCRSYDFEYMVCNFTQPANPVLTQYNLTFYTNSPKYNFDPICSYDEKPRVVCNTTLMHKYRPSVEHYYYTLRAFNELATHTYVQPFDVNNFEVMVPARPGDDLHVEYLSTDAIQLAWRMPKYDHYRSKGLLWEILLTPENFPTLNLSTTSSVGRSRNEMHLRVNDLPYAYYNYELKLRVRVRPSNGIIAAVSDLWSEAFVYHFRSAARRPDRPPRTSYGSFYFDSMETHVRLYWEQLELYEQNGNNFSYVVSEVRKDNKITKMTPLHMGNNSALFAWDKTKHYEFYLHSHNHVGDSLEASRIEIFPISMRSPKMYTPRAIHNVYHATNRTYTLTWLAPLTPDGLMSYTVYWCYSKRALQNECKGSIHFSDVSRNVYKFTTEPQSAQQEHTLNLAVSANYEDYNTGIHWTACTLDVNSDLVKMEPEVQPLSSTSIKVQWSPESVCPSILEGYNLTYCEVSKESAESNNSEHLSCLDSSSIEFRKIDNNAKKWEIGNLKPFTYYKVEMYMFSRFKMGKSSEPLLVRTLEAASTPPRQLQVSHVTNSSATITWLPPSQANGKIRFYVIILNNEQFHVPTTNDTSTNLSNYSGNNIIDADSMEKITYEFNNLTSFTSYKVYVIAQTVESSHPSNDIHFTTLIGCPSLPGNVVPLGDTRNDTLIQWTKPLIPAGRIDLYEVAVTQMRNEEIIQRRISIILGSTSCAMKVPTCVSPEYKTIIDVRAVNAALLSHEVSEVEAELDITTSSWHRGIFDNDADYYTGNDELICLGGRATDGSNKNYADTLKRFYDTKLYRLYKSEWQHGPTYGCSITGFSESTTIAIFIIISSLSVLAAFFVLRKQYIKMSNIHCKLPPGLDAYPTKDGYTSFSQETKNSSGGIVTAVGVGSSNKVNLKEKQLEIKAVKDFNNHNEKHHLLAAMVGSDTINSTASVASTAPDYLSEVSNFDKSLLNANTNLAEGSNFDYKRTYSESSTIPLIGSADSFEMKLKMPELTAYAANTTDNYINAAQMKNASVINDNYITSPLSTNSSGLDNNYIKSLPGMHDNYIKPAAVQLTAPWNDSYIKAPVSAGSSFNENDDNYSSDMLNNCNSLNKAENAWNDNYIKLPSYVENNLKNVPVVHDKFLKPAASKEKIRWNDNYIKPASVQRDNAWRKQRVYADSKDRASPTTDNFIKPAVNTVERDGLNKHYTNPVSKNSDSSTYLQPTDIYDNGMHCGYIKPANLLKFQSPTSIAGTAQNSQAIPLTSIKDFSTAATTSGYVTVESLNNKPQAISTEIIKPTIPATNYVQPALFESKTTVPTIAADAHQLPAAMHIMPSGYTTLDALAQRTGNIMPAQDHKKEFSTRHISVAPHAVQTNITGYVTPQDLNCYGYQQQQH